MEKPIFMYADSFGDFVWWVSYWLLCEPAGQWTLGIVTVALLGLVVKRKTRLNERTDSCSTKMEQSTRKLTLSARPKEPAQSHRLAE